MNKSLFLCEPDRRIPTLIDGMLVNTSPQSPRPIAQMQLQKFNGSKMLLAIGWLALLAACSKSSTGTTGPAESGSTTSASTGGKGDIKLGQTVPYSGNASAYSNIGKAEAAYFKMVNEKGGVNGHKIDLVTIDDAYNPSKAVEQTRKLVESDNVLAIFGSVGTPTNIAIQSYLEQKKVPQLFIATGADRWADPTHATTIGWQPSYRVEAKLYAQYVKKTKPNAKMCVLNQNDGFGKDYLDGLKDGFGAEHDKYVTKIISYEVTDATIDSQIVSLQGTGCDTILLASTAKFSAQAIRKIFDLGWKPLELMSNVSSSISAVIKPAGFDKSTGVITSAYLKDPSDPKLQADPGILAYKAFMKQHLPDIDANDYNAIYGYGAAFTMETVLQQCGADLSRENLMKESLHLDKLQVPVALDGIKISTGPKDFRTFAQMQLTKFNGTSWELFGEVLSAE